MDVRGVERGCWVEWTTATPAALQSFSSTIELDPAGGEQILELVVETPSQHTLSYFTRFGLVPDPSRFQQALGSLGHIGRTSAGPSGIALHVTTTEPDAALTALIAALPADLTDEVVITAHPARMTQPLPVYRG